MSKKTLILSLGRTGVLPFYGEEIAENFSKTQFDFYASKNRLVKAKRSYNIKEIKTYNGVFSFLINTLFVLPFYFIGMIPKILREYDVLYLPYKHFWDIPFVFLFKLLNKKIVFTAHDGWLHEGERNFFTQGLNNYRLNNSTSVIFLSKYVERLVKKKIRLKSKSVIIPLPIIENSYIKLNNNIDNNTKNILFLGRIDRYKGIELLMESVLLIENDFDKLIIAGKSNYDINYIKHPNIEIKDYYLTEQEMGDLLSWADLLVLPYTEATQSGVIALGIYAELPMLCTNVGGFKEQLLKDEAFWCEPNLDSLSKSLKEVLSMKEERLKIIEKMKCKKTKLTFKSISEQVENLLINNQN